jgi:flagellar biosynthesis protein FlhF
LPLHYVANGQRVPEDLHLPNASWLTRSALKLAAGAGDHKPANEDLPLMMSGGCLA